MRLKQSRVRKFYHKEKEVLKDGEGNTTDSFTNVKCFCGECWQAGGKLQVEMYGHRINNIMNIRVNETYRIKVDEKGQRHYVLSNGIDMVEGNGIHVFAPKDSEPDYKIIAIKQQRFLRLEIEKF